MALPQQPTLPPEEQFTDPELNFIDESLEDSSLKTKTQIGATRRKVFSDVIWEIYGQLHTIYSEIFPASSQTYLDEWEEMVGLPQNPANKSLQQRRTMVMNRLRGGPFTRTQRRNIVESYITATFGNPIILLPPGHGMEIGGSPLYNEPGDVSQLYMIVETIPNFQYEVRIKTAMALDQVGLERDLRWYTPAGIFIIFNYAWEGKWGTDSGTLVDTVDTAAGGGRKISVVDAGFGSEGIKWTVTDTGVGIDAGTITRIGIDNNGTTTENATVSYKYILDDGGSSIEAIGDFKSVRQDTGAGSDYGSLHGDSGGHGN